MKQISVISAKGGVGKTAITAAFASFANSLILVDCDTESNDLRLLLNAESSKQNDVKTNQRVFIQEDECIRCGLCKALCHFDAVRNDSGVYSIEKEHCQACDLCLKACPVSAIQHFDSPANNWGEAETQFGTLVYAQLALGEDLNGNLISILRDRARELAAERHKEIILIDGPPAVGYAVASTISGVDLAVIVVEPGPSAVHDIHKAIQLSSRYEVAVACLINKSDLNPEMTKKVKDYCSVNSIPMLGEIPFDTVFMQAQVKGVLLAEMDGSEAAMKILRSVWKEILMHIKNSKE
jgi:MinD superfamily P-loop ATPase